MSVNLQKQLIEIGKQTEIMDKVCANLLTCKKTTTKYV